MTMMNNAMKDYIRRGKGKFQKYKKKFYKI
jgi:hypothetical protein